MPAKKKRTTVDWRARAELAGRSAWVAIQENNDLRKHSPKRMSCSRRAGDHARAPLRTRTTKTTATDKIPRSTWPSTNRLCAGTLAAG